LPDVQNAQDQGLLSTRRCLPCNIAMGRRLTANAVR
jgi:hypothetical protein